MGWLEDSFLSTHEKIHPLLERYGAKLFLLAAALLPVRLLPSLILFVILIVSLLLTVSRQRWQEMLEAIPGARALGLFLLCMVLLSLFGLSPLTSFRSMFSPLFFSLIIFVGCFLNHNLGKTVFAMAVGHSIASIHSIVDYCVGGTVPFRLIGAVSESGQLAIGIPALLGFYFYSNAERGGNAPDLLRGGMLTIAGVLTCTALDGPGQLVGGATVIALLVNSFFSSRGSVSSFLASCAVPLMVVALLVNLKRGPWFGVLVSLCIFFSLHSPRLLIPIVCASIGAFLIPDLRNRVADVPRDFFIAGGRGEIWSIGWQMLTTYPLGIGHRMSGILRTYSELVPPELRHFHSNYLQIAVELGILGLFVFLHFVYSAAKTLFVASKRYHNYFFLGLGCAVVSWQFAGLVEYNVGDAEVLYLMYLFLGIAGSEIIKSKRPV